MFHILFERVNNFYESFFGAYGRFLAKHYLLVICAALALNCILSSGINRMEMITDSDELFTIIGSESMRDAGLIRKLFSEEKLLSKDHNLHQLVDIGTWGEVQFLTCPDAAGNADNILQAKYLKQVQSLHELVLNLNVTMDGRAYSYESVCAKRGRHCVVEGSDLIRPQFYEHKLNDFMNRKEQIRLENLETGGDNKKDVEQFQFYINGFSVTDLSYNLGRTFHVNSLNESRNRTEPAYSRYLKLRYSLNAGKVHNSKLVELWEKQFIATMQQLQANSLTCSSSQSSMRISYAVSSSLEIEMDKNLSIDTRLISITFMIIFILASILMSIGTNCISAPGMLLPTAGILSAGFGITSAFGFLSYIGYKSCNLSFVAPFLVIGVGVDDMFIIYSAYRHTHSKSGDKMDIAEVISNSLRRSGVSITITSLTDFFAFMVGLIADFKSVQIFCVYVGVSIIFCYFYQLTIFSGFLCVHVKRIEKANNSFIPCLPQSDLNKCCGLNENCATERYATDIVHENSEVIGLSQNGLNQEKIKSSEQQASHQSKKGFVFNWSNKAKRVLRFLITDKIGKGLVVFLYVIYISLSIWSGSQITEGIQIKDLVAEDSHYNIYMDDNSNMVNMNPIVMFVITEPIDYDKKANRDEINRVLRTAMDLPEISDTFSLNWLSLFADQRIRYRYNPKKLKEDLNFFPQYKNDIVISQKPNKTNKARPEYEISASRYFLQYSLVTFSSKDARVMHALKQICSDSFLPIIAYSVPFRYMEQFEATVPNIYQAFVFSSEIMFLIAIVFIPDLISVFSIILSMSSIMIGLLGAMNLLALKFSTITMVVIIMSIGFCIDFSAHIVHAFLADVGVGSRNDRAFKACLRVGVPIFNSALSTFFGICMLSFSNSFIFQVFFKTISILMLLGMLNALLFLPVLLSFIGPNWPRHQPPKKLESSTKPEPASVEMNSIVID